MCFLLDPESSRFKVEVGRLKEVVKAKEAAGEEEGKKAKTNKKKTEQKNKKENHKQKKDKKTKTQTKTKKKKKNQNKNKKHEHGGGWFAQLWLCAGSRQVIGHDSQKSKNIFQKSEKKHWKLKISKKNPKIFIF